MYLLLQADQSLKQNHEDLPLLAHLQELVPICERIWTDIEPGTQSNIAYPVSKKTDHSSSSWSIDLKKKMGRLNSGE